MTKKELKEIKRFAAFSSKMLDLPEPKISHDVSKKTVKKISIGWDAGKCTLFIEEDASFDFNMLSQVAYLLRSVWQINNKKTFDIPDDVLTGREIDAMAFAWCMMLGCYGLEPVADLPVSTVATIMDRMNVIGKMIQKKIIYNNVK
jgi:hypothetical protein